MYVVSSTDSRIYEEGDTVVQRLLCARFLHGRICMERSVGGTVQV